MGRRPLIVEYGQGSIRSLTRHRNAGLEIVLLSRGHLQWQVEGRSELLTPGSVFFTLPWQEHGSVDEFELGHHWYFVVLKVEKKDINLPGLFGFPAVLGFGRDEARRLSRTLRKARRHAYPASPLLTAAMPELLRELSQSVQSQRIAILTSVVLLELAKAIAENRPDLRSAKCSPERRIAAFSQELAGRSNELWTLASMAAWCGLGRSRFADLLKRQNGDTPVQFLNRLRVHRARHLLKTTAMSITAIAHACGFASSQYFAEIFHQFTGGTARDYRLLPDIPRMRRRRSQGCKPSVVKRVVE